MRFTDGIVWNVILTGCVVLPTCAFRSGSNYHESFLSIKSALRQLLVLRDRDPCQATRDPWHAKQFHLNFKSACKFTALLTAGSVPSSKEGIASYVMLRTQ